MSRVYIRGGGGVGRGTSGPTGGGPSSSSSSVAGNNPNSGNTGNRPLRATQGSSSGNHQNQRDRDWRGPSSEQETRESDGNFKDTSTLASPANPGPPGSNNSSGPAFGNFSSSQPAQSHTTIHPNPPQQQRQTTSDHPHQQQRQSGDQQQNHSHPGGGRRNQPTRPLYKPHGSSEKNRGPGGGGGPGGAGGAGNFDTSSGQHRDGNNATRQGGGPHKGHGGQRENARPPQKRPSAAPTGGSTVEVSALRSYDPVSSRETSSIDTQDNDDTLHGSRSMMGVDNDRENRENLHFPKTMAFGAGQLQTQHLQQSSGGGGNRKGGPDGGGLKQRGDEQQGGKGRPEQNRHPQMKVLQNSFNEPFGKSSLDSDLDRETDHLSGGFGQFKNGGVGILSHPGHGGFDEGMNLYSQKPPRYFPMGDIGGGGHSDKGMNDRSFQSTPHDSGDIFSKDVFWRGPEKEERRDVFLRDGSSPVIGKSSMIWSNQGSVTPVSHAQAESPHFGRPLMPGPFGMDPSGFGSGQFGGSPSSMLDSQHLDPLIHHQRAMGAMMHHQNIPMSQTFQGLAMSDRMHMGPPPDRMAPLFGNAPVPQMMPGPMRMGFNPHQQYSDSYMTTPMGREQGRAPPSMQQQHHQQQQNNPMNSGNSFSALPSQMQNMNAMPVSRSPQTPSVSQEKSWGGGWEEPPATVAPAVAPIPTPPPPKAPEPVENFGEFKIPALKGSKNFDNLCNQADELRQAIQVALKELMEKPHKERLRRVMCLCFSLWNAIRDAILLDNVQSCAKGRDLDQMMWREGFYPVYDLMRNLGGKANGRPEFAEIDQAMLVFLDRASKFYNDLIPKVLHPFGGSVTAHTPVSLLCMSAKGPIADHTIVSLELAERLLAHHGDIYRYLAELPGSTGTELNQAKQTYVKACRLSPYNGQPHCQLALVAKRMNQPLECAFHCIRALSTKLPYPMAAVHLSTLWPQVEKTYESLKWPDEKTVNWNETSVAELTKRFYLTFLAIHAALYNGKSVNATLNTQGTQFLHILDALLNQGITLPFRDVLLQMMSINIYRITTLTVDSHGYAFLMDLSFNMFDIVLARLLRIFEGAPDLDSAAHLEETTILSPMVNVFVEWIKSSYRKWFPLSPSLLSAPKDTKRTSMWSRLVSLVNLSLTLNIAGVSEDRNPDTHAETLHEDEFLNGMTCIHPSLQVFYRENRLHETIAEPRFRFKRMQSLGQLLLSVTPAVARLQWNRFLPTDSFTDKNVKHLWAPLEPPPSQPRVEPLPTLSVDNRSQESFLPRTAVPIQPERPDTSNRWKSANPPVNEAAEQAWPSLGQSTKLLTEERRERARTASTNSGDDGSSRGAKNGSDVGSSHESMRNNVEPWWLMDKRLRSNDAGSHMKLNGPEPDRKPMRQEVSSKQYFLVDTNCLIDYLERLEKKVSESDDLVVLVPGTVYRELWKLHQNKNLKAHFALSFINDAMEHHKGRVLVITTKGDSIPHAQLAKREVVIERGSNDDIILRTCLTLMEKGLVNPDDSHNRRPVDAGSWRGSLLLLTSDVNMRLKAKKENIYCGPVNDILNA